MNSIILGFNENENYKIELLLRQFNYIVHSKHTSFNEILRVESQLYNPIIITKEKLKDGSIFDFLSYTSKKCEHIIVTNKNQELDRFSTKVLCVNNPINKRQMEIALNIVSELNNYKLNNYKSIIKNIDYEATKNILITNFNFTEDIAHNFIQKRAMNMCVSKDVISNIIINSL